MPGQDPGENEEDDDYSSFCSMCYSSDDCSICHADDPVVRALDDGTLDADAEFDISARPSPFPPRQSMSFAPTLEAGPGAQPRRASPPAARDTARQERGLWADVTPAKAQDSVRPHAAPPSSIKRARFEETPNRLEGSYQGGRRVSPVHEDVRGLRDPPHPSYPSPSMEQIPATQSSHISWRDTYVASPTVPSPRAPDPLFHVARPLPSERASSSSRFASYGSLTGGAVTPHRSSLRSSGRSSTFTAVAAPLSTAPLSTVSPLGPSPARWSGSIGTAGTTLPGTSFISHDNSLLIGGRSPHSSAFASRVNASQRPLVARFTEVDQKLYGFESRLSSIATRSHSPPRSTTPLRYGGGSLRR